ncbi:MAG: glycosyltransferase [Candidatus Homeothermus sp.]|nr:glycosyltransferase [Candidatus Homeothermus sp.]
MERSEKVYGLFNDSFPPVLDGVTLTVQNYVRWLTTFGKRTCVVTPWNPVKPSHDGYDLYRYFSLSIASRKPYRYGYPKLDPFIWHKMRTVPFALVHSHCPFSSGRLALYAARKQHVPLIATFHSKYRTDLEHSLPGWMVKRIMSRVMTFFDAADEVWIPQAKVEETVREYGYKGKLTVVENGIDLEMSDFASIKAFKAEQRLKLGYMPETMVLLFVGQHIREKGVLLIIKAMDKLRDLPVKMEFIGTGYATEEMKNLIRQLHLEDKVTLNGVISDREVLKSYYGAADMFLFPSRYDNAPLVVREAAMMGTPAVLIAGSTASEVIKDGFNGFLVEESPESYASRIRSLYNDRSAIKEAAEGASKTLTRSWREVMEEVVGRYEEIIERYGRR